MTYDLHGDWTKADHWTGPYLNAHTNLTEIRDAMNIFWRIGVDPHKLTLGLAFYGRGFTATDPNWLEPGCPFESASNPIESCSNDVGFAMDPDFQDILRGQPFTITQDKDAAVNIITFHNQWITYESEDTMQMKADFARSQCLGGLMAWAISNDDEKTISSQCLARAAAREDKSALLNDSGRK